MKRSPLEVTYRQMTGLGKAKQQRQLHDHHHRIRARQNQSDARSSWAAALTAITSCAVSWRSRVTRPITLTLDTSRPSAAIVTGPFGATIAGQNLIDVTLAKLAAADPDLHSRPRHADQKSARCRRHWRRIGRRRSRSAAVRRANPDRAATHRLAGNRALARRRCAGVSCQQPPRG